MGNGTPQALIFGNSGILPATADLLTRVGFDVTAITSNAKLWRVRPVARLVRATERAVILPLARAALATGGYEIVVACDDRTLRRVRRADLPTEEKLRLLPVASERGMRHIASKIGLSRVLSEAGIRTPSFRVARTRKVLSATVAKVGFPVMVKGDFGMASARVERLQSASDLATLRADFPFPALVQKAIDGDVVDLSGFFRRGELVTFGLSTYLRTAHETGSGLSVLRRYETRPERNAEDMADLRALGRALDADGFCSITAIRAVADGRLYFFEADMRPTAWVNFPRFFGEDPAIAIAAAFGLPRPNLPPAPVDVPPTVDLAQPRRMPLHEVMLDRYGCRSQFEPYYGLGIVAERLDDWRRDNAPDVLWERLRATSNDWRQRAVVATRTLLGRVRRRLRRLRMRWSG